VLGKCDLVSGGNEIFSHVDLISKFGDDVLLAKKNCGIFNKCICFNLDVVTIFIMKILKLAKIIFCYRLEGVMASN
jgi:hypothetical protein